MAQFFKLHPISASGIELISVAFCNQSYLLVHEIDPLEPQGQ